MESLTAQTAPKADRASNTKDGAQSNSSDQPETPSTTSLSPPHRSSIPDWHGDPRAFKCVLCQNWHTARCPWLRNY
ncbi:hypothetical protein DTO212C5_560 [Paecilomyces variotii]|nr:hypothetical protein DTO212C5_560 [Paecilomyces variotii]KAJ9396437.1 hypothetical protein DTO282F9_6572 [Paecilomyces variotii]